MRTQHRKHRCDPCNTRGTGGGVAVGHHCSCVVHANIIVQPALHNGVCVLVEGQHREQHAYGAWQAEDMRTKAFALTK